MGLDRQRVSELIRAYYPAQGSFGQGTFGFDHIAKDYANSGTTCAFQSHWLMWRLNCSDASLINRYEPDSGFTYTHGANISRLSAHSAFVKMASPQNREAFRAGRLIPRAGDTILINGEPKKNDQGKIVQYDEHVYLVIGEPTGSPDTQITWPVANAGEGNVGSQSGRIIAARGVRWTGKTWVDTMDSREFAGWLNIDNVPASSAPHPVQWDPLASHSSESSSGPPKPESLIGTWRIEKPYRVSYYLLYKGFRAFKIESANLKMITDSGFWYAKSGKVTIWWNSYLQDDMTINGDSGTGEDDFSTYTVTKTLTTAAVMDSYKEGRGQPVNEKTRQSKKAGA